MTKRQKEELAVARAARAARADKDYEDRRERENLLCREQMGRMGKLKSLTTISPEYGTLCLYALDEHGVIWRYVRGKLWQVWEGSPKGLRDEREGNS